jgi:rhodanese-related sulfurtransferase
MASVQAPSPSDASRYEKCRAVAKSYQAKFDIPPLASETLIQMRSSDLLLIDVRTEPERRVSQIPGSISLAESHDRLQAPAVSGNRNLTVVTYCTMGYRSGIEAKAIQVQYPDIAVFNLDGIVAYAYAVRKAREQGYGQMIEYPLDRLHTFGSQWAIAPSGVTTVYFEGWELAGRMVQVKLISLSRNLQKFRLRTSFRLRCRRGDSPNTPKSGT